MIKTATISIQGDIPNPRYSLKEIIKLPDKLVEAQQLANDRRESEREQYKMTVEEIFEMVYREMEMNKNHFIIITPPNYLVKN